MLERSSPEGLAWQHQWPCCIWVPPLTHPQQLTLMLSVFIFEASLESGSPSSSPVQPSAALPCRMRHIQLCGLKPSPLKTG